MTEYNADFIIDKLKSILGKVTDEEKAQMSELSELDADTKNVKLEIAKVDREKFIKGIQPILYHKQMLCCREGLPNLIEIYENHKDYKIVNLEIPSQNQPLWWITFKSLNTEAMKTTRDHYVNSRLSTKPTIDMTPLWSIEELKTYSQSGQNPPMKHLLSNMKLLTSYIPHKKDEIFVKCWTCNKVKGTLKCGKCKVARYCSPSCQKGDWHRHKKMCMSSPIKESSELPLSSDKNPSSPST